MLVSVFDRTDALIGRTFEAEYGRARRVWLKRVFIGAVTAVVVVGFLLQSDFSAAEPKRA